MIDSSLKQHIKIMILGSLFYNVLLFIICLIVFVIKGLTITNVIKLLFCVFLGFVISCFYIYHLAISLNSCVDMQNEKKASAYSIKQTILRYLVIVVLIYLVYLLLGKYSSLFMLLGVFGVKFSAYLYPLIDNKIDKVNKKIF